MQRLTERDEQGNVDVIGTGLIEVWTYPPRYDQLKRIKEALKKLADYEDTRFNPADITVMRNELCLKCGNYQREHLGACNGCRWRIEK